MLKLLEKIILGTILLGLLMTGCSGSECCGTDSSVTAQDLMDSFDPFLERDDFDSRIESVKAQYASFQQNLYIEAQPDPRSKISLSGPWKFRLDRAGSLSSNGEAEGWFQPGYDDSSWSEVSLPDQAEFNRGWYRIKFQIENPQDGNIRFLVVENIDQGVKTWVNGIKVLEHEGFIGARLSVDISGEVQAGENLLAVEVINFYDPLNLDTAQISTHDGRDGRPAHGDQFGNNAMFGGAWIEETNGVHIAQFLPVTQATDNIIRGIVARPDAEGGRFTVGFQVRNHRNSPFSGEAQVKAYPLNFTGQVSQGEAPFSVEAQGLSSPVWIDVPLIDPKTWTIETPYLYEIEVSLLDETSQLLDRLHESSGLRDLSVEQDGTILLNGSETFLRGASVNFHKILISREDAEKMMQIFKAANLNAIKFRFAPEYLNIADRYGLIAYLDLPSIGQPWEWIEDTEALKSYSEALPDGHISQWTDSDWSAYRSWYEGVKTRSELKDVLIIQLHELIDRVVNHPSVAFYAPTHETDPFRDNLTLFAELFRRGRDLDPTRFVSPDSGRAYVPGYPYDRNGCLDQNQCWHILDHHSHEAYYYEAVGEGATTLDYWEGRSLLHFDDYNYPPFDENGLLNFWRSGRNKALFSELAGAEALPDWGTVEEWNDLEVFNPPVTSDAVMWNPGWINPLDAFLAGDDLDNSLFRNAEEEGAYTTRKGQVAQRFDLGGGWCRLRQSSGECEPSNIIFTMGDWIEKTQDYQATYLRLSIDALRRMKEKVSGYYQFAMTATGSPASFPKELLDEHGNPKLGYYLLAQSNAPVHVQLKASDAGWNEERPFDLCINRNSLDVWVINDTERTLKNHTIHVIAILAGTEDTILHSSSYKVTIEPFSAEEYVSDISLGLDPSVEYNLIAFLTDREGKTVDTDFLKRPVECP